MHITRVDVLLDGGQRLIGYHALVPTSQGTHTFVHEERVPQGQSVGPWGWYEALNSLLERVRVELDREEG